MRQKTIRIALAALIGSFILFAGVGADAQKKGAGGVIRLEETVIEGRVQKPNAFFINTRQGMVYEVMELRESFVAEIPKAIEDGEF